MSGDPWFGGGTEITPEAAGALLLLGLVIMLFGFIFMFVDSGLFQRLMNWFLYH